MDSTRFPNMRLNEVIISKTPPEVLEILTLKAQIERLENLLGRNSSNSNQPPSLDSPFDKQAKPESNKGQEKKTRKIRRQRKGHIQRCLRPTRVVEIQPKCSCGCEQMRDLNTWYIHQMIDIPEIRPQVTHFLLHEGRCQNCGKEAKGSLPEKSLSGFGPRLSALTAELVGIMGNSRRAVQDVLRSVFGIPISQGGLQKVLNRASSAILPHYDHTADQVRRALVNHADETTWRLKGKLHWLRVLGNQDAALFRLHPQRSKKAFEELTRIIHKEE